MANTLVNIADMAVSGTPDDLLVTYSLGSCLGVTAYDSVAKVGGMIHCMLPLSQIDADKALDNPCMFVDIGIPRLLDAVLARGATKKNLVIKAAGCSTVLDNKGLFRVGERNYAVFRKILWKNSLLIAAEDIGGNYSRTLRLEMMTGKVTIKSGGEEKEL